MFGVAHRRSRRELSVCTCAAAPLKEKSQTSYKVLMVAKYLASEKLAESSFIHHHSL